MQKLVLGASPLHCTISECHVLIKLKSDDTLRDKIHFSYYQL